LGIKRLYIVRHGQTDFNLKGVVQGSGIDAPLNANGMLQAEKFFKKYQNYPFDKVYVSALQRTKQSVQGFIDSGFPYESLVGLNEISWGEKEGQAFTPDGDKYYYWVLEQWQKGQTDLPIAGGESPDAVAKRMQPALDYIMRQTDEQNVLICMHGRAMRILFCMMLNYGLQNMDIFEHSNLCLYQFAWTGSMFTLEKYNDQGHLI
jgi:broad specificity phosphatase PhoE